MIKLNKIRLTQWGPIPLLHNHMLSDHVTLHRKLLENVAWFGKKHFRHSHKNFEFEIRLSQPVDAVEL